MEIPNPISWSAHKQGKKHVVKEKELARRQAEGKRTCYVTGEVVATPVAELLLREHFESTFGPVEKMICQERFCLVVFESEAVSGACASQKDQEFSGYKIQVKPRIQNFGAVAGGVNNAKTLAIIKQLNSAADLSKQLAIVDMFYGSCQIEMFQKTLEAFLERLKLEVDKNINFTADLIGSAKYQLQTPSSDFDINFRVEKVNPFALDEKFVELGRKTVRNEPHNARKDREQTRAVLYITGKIVSLSKAHPISSVHAVIGARKPVIRMNLAGKKLEISIANTAASVNTRFFDTCLKDHLFLHLMKITKFIYSHGELSRAGRFSSYSILIAMYSFLITKKNARPIEHLMDTQEVELEEGLEEDSFCRKQWDYRLPKEVPFQWPAVASKEAAVKLLFELFFEFTQWLGSLKPEIVIDIRSGQNPPVEQFLNSYSLTELDFKVGILNIADPFELEHNTTSHITAKTLHKMSKVFKSFAIKAKMKRVTNFIEDQSASSLLAKDWGVSVLIGFGESGNRMQTGQSGSTTVANVPRAVRMENEYTLNMSLAKKPEFFSFLDKVLRIRIPEKLINSSMEEMEISPKKIRINEEEMSSDSIDSGHESIGESFDCSVEYKLWEGRRSTRRQLEREYKNCAQIDIDAQVSALLLSKQPKKLAEVMSFRLQVTDSGVRLQPEKKSQDFAELFRFLEQAVSKYFLSET